MDKYGCDPLTCWYYMKLTFVLKDDILEICGAIATIWCLCFALSLGEPIGLCFASVFGFGSVWLYRKKNYARWCDNCEVLMERSTEPAKYDTEYEVVYKCKVCRTLKRAGIFTEYPR